MGHFIGVWYVLIETFTNQPNEVRSSQNFQKKTSSGYPKMILTKTNRAPIRGTKSISPPQELEGGVHSAPNFIFTSLGAQRAPI